MSDQTCASCGKEFLLSDRQFGRTSRGPRWCQPCWQIENAEEIEADAKCDRWHKGYFAKERPTDPDELEGWLHAREQAKVRVVMPERPEDYYHMPLGTFE